MLKDVAKLNKICTMQVFQIFFLKLSVSPFNNVCYVWELKKTVILHLYFFNESLIQIFVIIMQHRSGAGGILSTNSFANYSIKSYIYLPKVLLSS